MARIAGTFDYLCNQNAVTHNPVKGVARPKAESGEGRTPALGDHQARKLLAAPEADTLKSKRNRAILSTLLFHAQRREDLCKLAVRDFRHARKGVPHLRISGKGGKMDLKKRETVASIDCADWLAHHMGGPVELAEHRQQEATRENSP